MPGYNKAWLQQIVDLTHDDDKFSSTSGAGSNDILKDEADQRGKN
jgi:hypothetical protein